MDNGQKERIQRLLQLRAFAQQDGLLLALLWIASFACMIWFPSLSLSSVLMLATPFFVIWREVQFRNYALNGVLSFAKAFVYTVETFFLASLLFALAQSVYFLFIDNGRFLQLVNDSVNALMPIYKANGMDASINDALSLLATLSAVEKAFVFFTQNVMIGFILSLPIALLCKKS